MEQHARNFVVIFQQLTDALAWLHDRSIVFGDLSPNNVLIDPESLKVWLIDFEGASQRAVDFTVGLHTHGFAPKSARGPRLRSDKRDDLYGLGANMLAFLFRINSVLDVKPTANAEFLEAITSELLLGKNVSELIIELMQDDAERRPQLADVRRRLGECSVIVNRTKHQPTERDWNALAQRAMSYVMTTIERARSDRLFPAAPQVFASGPLSVAYGAAGIAFGMHRVTGRCPESVLAWIDERLQGNGAPPGLFVGRAGIAWTWLEVGLEAKALDLLREDHRSATADLFTGLAGIGMANLRAFLQAGDSECLARAIDLAEALTRTRQEDQNGYFWNGATTREYGLCHGAAGIALFLLYLGLASGDTSWIETGRCALQSDLSKGIRAEGRGLTWFASDMDSWRLLPYWESGSAGIGSVVVRYLLATGDETLGETLREICVATDYLKFAVLPGHCTGLAGIGDFLLDMWMFTGDDKWREMATRTAEGIMLFAAERPGGIAFPGEGQQRITCDYATGVAGIAGFFDRLANRRAAAFRLDDLIAGGYSGRLAMVGLTEPSAVATF